MTDAGEGAPPTKLNVWALPERRLERTVGHAEASEAVLVADRLLTLAADPGALPGRSGLLVRHLPFDGTAPEVFGRWDITGITRVHMDSSLTGLFSLRGARLVQQRLDDLAAPGRVIGTHEGAVGLRVRPWRDWAVTVDRTGELRIWDVPTARLERTLKSPTDASLIALDPSGRFIATGPSVENTPRPPWLFLFDLAAPRAAEPEPLLGDVTEVLQMNFSSDGAWLATAHNGTVIVWNMRATRSTVIGRQDHMYGTVGFTPDGELISLSPAKFGLTLWTMSPAAGEAIRRLWSRPGTLVDFFMEVDPKGRFAVFPERFAGSIHVVPLDGSPASTFELTRRPGTDLVAAELSLEPNGRLAAVAVGGWANPAASAVRIVDLPTGKERILDTHPEGPERCEEPGSELSGFAVPVWLRDGRLLSDGDAGLRVWDLASGKGRLLRACREIGPSGGLTLDATPDSRSVLSLKPTIRVGETSWLSAFDLDSGTTREITTHGNRLFSHGLDASGTILVTGGWDGVVRVGPLTGEEPHLLFGHAGPVYSVAVSPDGRWIASGGDDGTIRLWPMPDLSKPPLHTLPHDELLAKLKSLTNLRAVRDPASDTGWKIEIGPFPGWDTVPEWNP